MSDNSENLQKAFFQSGNKRSIFLDNEKGYLERDTSPKINRSNRNGKMREPREPRDFREDGGDRGGYNEGAAWNRKPARRDMDIVDKELNRYQPAFDHVQRYPEGYGGQPVRNKDYGGGGGRRRGGGGMDNNKFDRFISAIEGLSGGGGNITNTFNPTFNPTNVNAGGDIRDTAILGGDNTAGRDIVGAGSGDVETGDGGGGNTVTGGPSTTVTNPGGGGGTTEPPGGTTEPPGGTKEPPGGTKEPPGGTTEPPGGTTEPPGGTIEPPFHGDPELPKCPTPDMQILLSDKSQKPAGELQVGDEVRTAHEKDFTIGNYKVTRVDIVDSPIVKVNFEGKSITCSPSHKFYSETDDTWTSAEDLKEDDRVSLEDGEITFVSKQQISDGKVVSITVDDAHTYICEGFLSHNKTLAPEEENKYDSFINKTYNDLIGRDAGQEGLDYWSGDLESGQTEQQVIDNIKLSPEYLNREKAKSLASSMEGKTYDRDDATTGGSIDNNINEGSLDAWIGAGGSVTQSSDADAAGYYEGVGDKSKAAEFLYNRPVGDGDTTIMGFPSNLSDRDDAIYNLYTDVMGRNPDAEGLEYWTGAGGEGMSLGDIEASFRGSAEQKLRDDVSGTNNFVSTDESQKTSMLPSIDELMEKPRGLATEDAAKDAMIAAAKNNATNKSTSDRVNAYIAATGQTGADADTTRSSTLSVSNPSSQNYNATTAGAIANQQKQYIDMAMPGTKTGGGLSTPEYASNALKAINNAQSSTKKPEDWLQQAYTEAGLGTVDAGGRDYWMKDISSRGQSQADVIANIMRHKK